MVPRFRFALVTTLAVSFAFPALAQDTIRVLLLTRSAAFEHLSIREVDGAPGHVQSVLQRLADQHGVELTSTKDAGMINAKTLKAYDLVIFYTSGDLTQEGKGKSAKGGGDGGSAMPASGISDLTEWIKGGGGFMGFHSATDTFGKHKPDPEFPYIKVIGAEFKNHGPQFKGTVKVVDQEHPTMANFPNEFSVLDEWYVFMNLQKETLHVLALLDPGEQRNAPSRGPKDGPPGLYNIPNYPIVWCHQLGEGRVYYNAMGHREDVWDNETFQLILVDAAAWTLGKGESGAEPNFRDVVPAE